VNALVAVLALPLFGALMAVALPGRAARIAALAAVAATLTAAIGLAASVVSHGLPRLEVGGWTPPVGIVLEADGLSVALIVMTALVMTAASLSARHLLAPEVAGPRAAFGFWPLMLLLWAALNAVFLSRDLFNLYVGIELLSLSAIGLVAIEGKADALAAAMRYMIFALAGSLLYLAGVVLVYSAHGALDIGLLAARTPADTDGLALALMTAGLMAKTALFPFHVWLPPAHGGAPAPASAMLSALVPKASFLILLRLWFDVMPDRAAEGALTLMAGLGAAAVVWGSLAALVQVRLKLVVAYSTVAQIGYLFLVFPLAGGASAEQPWAAGAWNGAVFLALSHGLAKAAMFLAVGQWMSVRGSDRLDELRGFATAMPMTTFAFALSSITLIGLPPSGGFTAKYLIMTSAFAAGQWGWALVMAGGGLLAAAYLYRPMAVLFARADKPAVPFPSRARQAVPLVLAGTAIALGIASEGPFELFTMGRPQAAEEGL
jgi:formate hydrogenlyase subunit 3/multisubunit Na+/H+ antiporter MnhD subunit